MLTLGFSTHDLARTRFAASPLQEVIASIRVLKEPGSHVIHQPWVQDTAPLLRSSGLDLSPLTDLVPVPSYYIPDFLTPPPTTPTPDFHAEIAALRRTAPEQIRSDLHRMVDGRSPSVIGLNDDPVAGLARLVEVIEGYWDVAIAPHWPRIHTIQQGDVLYRARRLADGGAPKLFDDLAPIVRWHQERLYIAHPRYSGSYPLDGRGLLLMPSVFVWPTVFSSIIEPWQPTLTYPARGVASLWQRGNRSTPDALAAVLGRTRALLLTELDLPTPTTELAYRTGLALGSVSEHLTMLRAAGLVTAHRAGRFVLYSRTTVAESLLAAAVSHGLHPD